MNAIAFANVHPAPLAPLPAWVRGILFAVNAAEEVPSSSDVDRRDAEAAKLGDGEAYSRIIRRHQEMIARRMTRFARDRGAIEELVHDCFVEGYLSLRTYRGDAPMEHWLMKIATRVGYRYWKSQRQARKRRENLETMSPPTAPAAAGSFAVDSVEMVNFLLEQLSPRDRLAITLLHLEGRDVREAAEMAGWSQTMMKVQAYRARKKLRALLEAQGVHDG